MRGVVKKWGNSAAIRLPSSMMKSLKIDIESLVEISLDSGNLVIKPVRSQEYELNQLINGIKPNNIHAEIDFGSADI